MGKFVYFTSTEKRQANEVDLPSFLRDRGEKLLQAGREYRLVSDHSITVRANRWYDHAARRGRTGTMTCGRSGVAMGNLWILLAAGGVMAAVIGCLTLLNNRYTLNSIKSKTVGDGQHGTARWATDAEIRKTYALVPFQAASWRKGLRRPEVQGLVLGSISHKRGITALVDKDDVHCLMIGASGVGKTAYFLYPNLEYACASGMSFLALDTKGDLARNYGAIAEKYYGYHVSVVDLRNPTRSDGYNLMTLINHYMDAAQATGSLAARAKAEKYAKILAKTVVSPDGDTDYGQNAYFYDAAEGLLTSVVLLLAEFLPPERKQERRHIVSVFKLVQELLAPSGVRGKNWFAILMEKLPPGSQGTVVCRGGAEHIRPSHGLGHEHGIVSPQRFFGLRAGAGAVF